MKFNDIEQKLLNKLPIGDKDKQTLQRRLNKLKRDPKGFVEDSYAKRKDQARKYLPIKHDGKFHYTVVSAVYNVEKYLDEYFESLVNQSLNFKKYIQIILVDDGSTDSSAQIIKKWQKKYPKNIHYYYKENGGQASARNLGLQYVETEWVTFIDPDDFVNVDYFKNADDVLAHDNSIVMAVGNIQFYYETKNIIADAHPLKYRFSKDINTVPLNKLGKNINLSVAISFFNVQHIKNHSLSFDDRVKPSFEDAKFIADYLIGATGSATFLKNTVYYYRKREDGSSTLDKAGQDVRRYGDIYKFGIIEMLRSYHSRFGEVPENIQVTALYDFIWQLKLLLNNPERISFLTKDQKDEFYALCYELFKYIDAKQIMKFNLADTWFMHKVGMLGQFKAEKPNMQICYIESVDFAKKQICISYFTHFDIVCNISISDKSIVPIYHKKINSYLNESLFVSEHRFWIPFNDLNEKLSISLDGMLSEIKFKNKSAKNITIKSILDEFKSNKYKSDGSWLFMDRETKADDNAEHLYRYVKQHYPNQVCYFALNEDSADWQRLSDDGFDLVAFGSPEFELRLRHCDKIISSHIDAHIHNYFGDLYDGTKDFVFLQHGVTKDNLSRWLNGKKHVACFITTTKDEYQSIVMGDRYKFSAKEVVLTGFPRHDALYQKQSYQHNEKMLLIMPTWRSYLMGETVGKGANTRTLNPQFFDSSYAKHWVSLLQSAELQALAQRLGYQLVFAPHANIEPYLDQIQLPSHIQIWRASESLESMQELFVRASMMITDYSSVAFEMAYINKPTLYYQFDQDEFFSGSHSYQKGYFDYEEHGFGAVVYDEQALLTELEHMLSEGVGEVYAKRIKNTFEYQDDGNCERVYQAIMALDKPSDDGINLDVLQEMLASAYTHQAWSLVVERATLLLEHKPDDERYQAMLAQALVESGQYDKADELLADKPELAPYELRLQLAFIKRDWQAVTGLYAKIVEPSFEQSYMQLQALSYLGNGKKAEKFAQTLLACELSHAQRLAVTLWLYDIKADYAGIITLAQQVDELETAELQTLKPQLLLAKAYRMLEEYDLAHGELVKFEKHTRDDVDCRIQIAELAFARGNYGKCVGQFDKLQTAGVTLSDGNQKIYIQSLINTKQWTRVLEILDQQTLPQEADYRLQVAFAHHDWLTVVQLYDKTSKCFQLSYLQVQALYHLNEQIEAKKLALQLLETNLNDAQKLAIELWLYNINADYESIIAQAELINELDTIELQLFKPQLLLAKTYRMLEEYDLAHGELVKFEKHTAGDVDCRTEIIELAFARGNYKKCIDQLEKLWDAGVALSQNDFVIYIHSLYASKEYAKVVEMIPLIYELSDELKVYHIKSLIAIHEWQQALAIMAQYDMMTSDELTYERVLTYYRQGMIEEAYQAHSKPTAQHSYEYWELIAELAFLMGDKELERYCYRGMIAIYPEQDKQSNINKLALLMN